MSKVDKSDIEEEIAASIKKFSALAREGAAREHLVIEMPEFIRKKAALISAHFLLPAGSRIVDMACNRGEVTYALALLNPRTEFIGIDRDAGAIAFARKTYRLPNLSFRQSAISIPDLEDESVDGIINSNVLHRVYSAGGYNQDEVFSLLEQQVQKLKPGGTMLIRDYMLPAEDEFVLMELPNLPSAGDDPMGLSDADLLVRFSQTARPMAQGCEGFFIEELMPRREGTRLFRLLHKWALEFIHRKNSRSTWESDLKEEYTFATYQDFRREFMGLGMRMVFSSPYWNPWVVKHCFKGRFQLYEEDGTPMSPPATNYFIVTQKTGDRQSLALEERRPSQKPASELQIMVVRDKKGGDLHELVKRPGEYCDIVPYRITPDNRLVIYVRSGYPRPIVNAVSRGTHNLDGKKWSGHLVEPVTMDTVSMTDDVDTNRRMIFDYVRDYAGLRAKSDDAWYVGETYFPSPDRIDEAIEPVFIEVENPRRMSWPISSEKEMNFIETGAITELDAADIIAASQVGLLPEPRLEMHVFDLMARHGIPLPQWLGEEMPEIPVQKIKTKDPEDILAEAEKAEFEEEKKGAVTLRAVKSVFVEEGKSGRGTRGLSAQDVEFIVSEDGVENIAIVLPMSRDWDDNLLVALEPKIMPVPNRLGGDGAMLNAPSFVLPRDVKTIDDAKAFIAGKFKVPVDHVASLGESYFAHTGITPQRIYPFMVAATASAGAGRNLQFMMMKKLHKLGQFTRASGALLKMLMRAQMLADNDSGMSMGRSPVALTRGKYTLSTDKLAVEAKHETYSGIPSRILGQRGGTIAPAKPAADVAAKPPAYVGPRLMESYAQAKQSLKTPSPIRMQETAPVQKVDTAITAVGKKLKEMELSAHTPVLVPPEPGKRR